MAHESDVWDMDDLILVRLGALLSLPATTNIVGYRGGSLCPKCGGVMTGGAPHGPWPVQWECRRCGYIEVPASGDNR